MIEHVFSFPRSAWERKSGTLCVPSAYSAKAERDAERRTLAFPRGAWERETLNK
jgi:hypothetical protein